MGFRISAVAELTEFAFEHFDHSAGATGKPWRLTKRDRAAISIVRQYIEQQQTPH